jgi:hypothetical protein
MADAAAGQDGVVASSEDPAFGTSAVAEELEAAEDAVGEDAVAEDAAADEPAASGESDGDEAAGS